MYRYGVAAVTRMFTICFMATLVKSASLDLDSVDLQFLCVCPRLAVAYPDCVLYQYEGATSDFKQIKLPSAGRGLR